MIEQELLILGILKEGPKHGYDIKRIIKDVIQTFTSLDVESIYYPLRVMEKKGYIKKEVGRFGRRPEKYTYHLSPKGNLRFNELLNNNFLSIRRPFFNIDLSLYFLPYVSGKVAQRQLFRRLNILNHIKSSLQKVARQFADAKTAYHLLAILKHNLELIEAEIKFTGNLIQTVSNKPC